MTDSSVFSGEKLQVRLRACLFTHPPHLSHFFFSLCYSFQHFQQKKFFEANLKITFFFRRRFVARAPAPPQRPHPQNGKCVRHVSELRGVGRTREGSRSQSRHGRYGSDFEEDVRAVGSGRSPNYDRRRSAQTRAVRSADAKTSSAAFSKSAQLPSRGVLQGQSVAGEAEFGQARAKVKREKPDRCFFFFVEQIFCISFFNKLKNPLFYSTFFLLRKLFAEKNKKFFVQLFFFMGQSFYSDVGTLTSG